MVNRRGNGKLRHVRVGMLWTQERVEEGGDSTMHEVTGGDEPKADDPQLKRVRCCANPPGDACTSFA